MSKRTATLSKLRLFAGMSALPQSKLSRAAMETSLACLSVGLNIFLAAVLLRPEPVSSIKPESAPASAQKDSDVLPFAPATSSAAETNQLEIQPLFHWSEIESSNFRQYIANLRAVGCPEMIIQELVQADLNQIFASRAAAIRKPTAHAYWQKSRPEQPSPVQRRRLAELEKEQAALFEDLFGTSRTGQNLVNLLNLQVFGNEEQLLFLPPDKRDQALEALRTAGLDSMDQLELQINPKSFETRLRALAKVLSPAELEEFRLRNSPVANGLRTELEYFNCTPYEFQMLLAAREQTANGQPSFPDFINRAPATEEVRKLFGDERAAEFERVTDLMYINIRHSAEEEGIALERIERAWLVTRDTRRELKHIANDTERTLEVRKQQMQVLRQNADARLAELLGERASAAARRELRTFLGMTEAWIRK